MRLFRRELKDPLVFLEKVMFAPGNVLKIGRIVLQFIDFLLQLGVGPFELQVLFLKMTQLGAFSPDCHQAGTGRKKDPCKKKQQQRHRNPQQPSLLQG